MSWYRDAGEVEPPWIELHSDYILEENMTFEIDCFLIGENFGIRWENPIRITKIGIEQFSTKFMEIIEL